MRIDLIVYALYDQDGTVVSIAAANEVSDPIVLSGEGNDGIEYTFENEEAFYAKDFFAEKNIGLTVKRAMTTVEIDDALFE
ncbi:MAG: hypothetical protein LBI48_09575 [Burkholderiaceae bacterium]|nr:hypothetical protein [Burkholderiaceae bacterium]